MLEIFAGPLQRYLCVQRCVVDSVESSAWREILWLNPLSLSVNVLSRSKEVLDPAVKEVTVRETYPGTLLERGPFLISICQLLSELLFW